MINIRFILLVLGLLLVVEGFFMLLTACVTLLYGGDDLFAFLASALICIVSGGVVAILTRNAPKDIGKREGYLIVSLVWIVFSYFGMLPFIMSGAIPSVTNAFFETMSGFTTTGSSILDNIEELSHGVLFWRSLIQWLGGMGIIVLSLAILPVLGVGGMQLFVAEVPGPVPDKLHPRIKETARRLWIIYLSLTIAESVLLRFGGMNWFDSICHSFTSMATGGYSTKQASVAHWDSPYIHYVIILFMFLAGMNFTLSYSALHGRFRKVFKDEEFRYYWGFTLGFTLLVGLALFITEEGFTIERAFRDALFQVVSIVTTTGYATGDYLLWIPFISVVMFALMFFGGSAGSTGGGIKIVRIVLLLKNSYYELKRLVHPNAIIPIRFNSRSVSQSIVTNVLAFIVFYMMIVGIGTVLMSMLGLDLPTSLGAVATSLGNIGPGLGSVGPANSFSHIPDLGKWLLSLMMLMGRLELFTVILIFTPAFWNR